MPEITLLNGDCLEIMKTIDDKSIDLIICDLPYGCLNISDTKEISNKQNWDVPLDLEKFWTEVRRIRKNDHTPCIHFCTTKFGYDLIRSNEKEFRYDLVWNKGRGIGFLCVNKRPLRSHEMIYVFSKSGAKYNRVDVLTDKGPYKAWRRKFKEYSETSVYSGVKRGLEGASRTDGTRCVVSVIDVYKNGTFKDKHPTEKPVELYTWLIERYSSVGDTVLDPTFGSGNSVFTAYNMGRNAIGIEKSETYFNNASNMLEEL
jgi:site-specific DNA-methyltransferase (adenine-specific)